MLQEYKLIINFLEKAKVNQLEFFSQADFISEKTMITKLYHAIREHDFKNFQDLEAATYGSNENSWKFKKLISRFQEKLINTLFFVDSNSPLFSERAKAYYVCARRTTLVRMLVERGARKIAVNIAEITLTVSLKYEFTDLSVFLSKFLMKHYSSYFLDLKKFKYYKNIFTKVVTIEQNELLLESYSCEINFEIVSVKGDLHKNLNMVFWKSQVDKAVDLINANPTIETILTCSIIIFEYYRNIKDFQSYKAYTFLIIDKIFNKPFLSVVSLEAIISAQLRITMITKDKKTADDLHKLYFDILNVGNYNWYVLYFYYVLTLFHSKDYQNAFNFIEFCINFNTFQKQPNVILEIFYILQAFGNFLLQIGKIENSFDLGTFRLNKFINQVPDHSRDKQGINIPIILVQILFFLADKKYSKIIDRIESLNLYSYRHLKKDENFRSQCFIRMISEMVRADFRKQGTIFRTEKLLNRMKAVPIDTYPATAETEIIPYEDLWEMVVERLD